MPERAEVSKCGVLTENRQIGSNGHHSVLQILVQLTPVLLQNNKIFLFNLYQNFKCGKLLLEATGSE
jgi:hypothetical protein